MSQSASTETALNPSSADGTSFSTQEDYSSEQLMAISVPLSAESDASHLMDDLFQDLDQLLGAESLSVAPSYEDSYLDPNIETEPALTPATETGVLSLQSSSLVPQLEERGEMAKVSTAIAPQSSPQPQPELRSRPLATTYDRLLLAVGCLSVIVMLAVWLIYQEGRRASAPVASAGTGTATTPSTQDNNQFADYVQKYLQNIDQKQGTLPSSDPSSAATATVTIPPTVAPGSTQSATGLSRIYVPVYEFPSNFAPPGTTVAPLPGAPTKPGAVGVRPNVTAPNSYNLPFGTNKPGGLPGVQPNQSATSTAAVPRKLVGVLDQGKNSVALFEINGVTQRYEIGESIGSSGWALVEVTKDQALIRRNGEVRSLFVGHSF